MIYFVVILKIKKNDGNNSSNNNDNYQLYDDDNNEDDDDDDGMNNKLSIQSRSYSSNSRSNKQTFGIFAIKNIFSLRLSDDGKTNLIDDDIEDLDDEINLIDINKNNNGDGHSNNNNDLNKFNVYKWTLIIMRGIFGALNNGSIIYAICLLSLGDAMICCSLSIIIIIPFLSIFFNENDFVIYNKIFTLKYFLCLILLLIGIILIIKPSFIAQIDNGSNNSMEKDPDGWIWAICGSIMASSIYITLKKAEQQICNMKITYLFYSHSIICSLFGVIMCYTHYNSLYKHIKNKQHILLLILIAFISFSAQFLHLLVLYLL